MQKIDIEKIRVEVEAAAKGRDYPENIPEFESQYVLDTSMFINYEPQTLEENIKGLAEYAMLSEYPAYFGRGIKAIIKRLVIKFVRFYVLPVLEMQNLFNNCVKEASTQLYANSLLKDKQIQELQKQIEELKKQVEESRYESGERR